MNYLIQKQESFLTHNLIPNLFLTSVCKCAFRKQPIPRMSKLHNLLFQWLYSLLFQCRNQVNAVSFTVNIQLFCYIIQHKWITEGRNISGISLTICNFLSFTKSFDFTKSTLFKANSSFALFWWDNDRAVRITSRER